jgi:hypothetical protein
MTVDRSTARRRGLLAAVACVAALTGAIPAASARADELVARPVLGAPATDVAPFGTETAADGAHAWAYGRPVLQPALVGGAPLAPPGGAQPSLLLLRAGADGVWTVAGTPEAADGTPLLGFELASATTGRRALAAQMTARGGGLLVGTDGDGRQVLVVRDPGGAFRAIPAPAAAGDDDADDGRLAGDDPSSADTVTQTTTTATATTSTTPALPPTSTTPSPAVAAPQGSVSAVGALAPGERLYDPRDSLLPAAPVDDGDRTGVLVAPAPADGGASEAVLRWDGSQWTREPVEQPAGATDLRVVALAATSLDDAWLLARSTALDTPFILFRRDPAAAGGPRWRRFGDLGAPLLSSADVLPAGVTVATGTAGQPLTATADGVWVDGTIAVGGTTDDLTFFVGRDGAVAGSWCDAPGAAAPLCARPLGRDRTVREYRSVAWAGDGFGTRIVSGYGAGAVLRFTDGGFQRVLGVGRTIGDTGAIAFASAADGWVGGSALARVTERALGDATQPWPVPFRRPLLAVAAEPGKPVGALDAKALAVGDDGQVARYTPGSGWSPEFLLDGNDARATPTLRGVAWPTAELAFAVGDDGAMWRWRAATGLWESDPGKPLDYDRHLTAIAFDPADPDRGYAVGKDGALLGYQKSWEEQTPPPGLEHAQFTSIAFAGSEALVTYRTADPADSMREVGGLIANDGSGWRVVEQAGALLAQLGGAPLRRVAALPDGGAVAAGPDAVIERDGPGAPWRFSSAPLAGVEDVAALAAVRDGDRVRAVVSVDPYLIQTALDYLFTDVPQAPIAEGAPPFRVGPDPLPTTGFLLRETADGWRDEQHAAFGFRPSSTVGDAPIRPDSVLALLLSPTGDAGWAVGGETGTIVKAPILGASESIQTAGVLRYPSATQAPEGMQTTSLDATAGAATFAIGGGARCAELCAALATTAPGPDRWLPAALQRAAGIRGLRGFLYTGGRLSDEAAAASPAVRADEFHRYASLMASAGAMPVFAAASPSDADSSGSTAAFGSAFEGFGEPFGTAAAAAGVTRLSRTDPGSARTYYAFQSDGPEGSVRVVVLDYSAPALDRPQLCWLASRLIEAASARTPVVVVGARPLTAGFDGTASDATTVGPLLAGGVVPPACTDLPPRAAGDPPPQASAYFFALRGENRAVTLAAGGGRLPLFGTGSLGYSAATATQSLADFSASGFLLAAVDVRERAGGERETNQASVTVRLIPSIAELALDATDGTLLRRSEPALFEALARRPRGGMRYRAEDVPLPDPYVPIPARCLGSDCASFIAPEYEFRSSRSDVGDFVRQDPDAPDDHTVLLGADDKPIVDHTSGLFCPFNPGTTTVTVRAGGLVYSQTVTVQPGSVRRPCGTVPLTDPPPEAPQETVPEMQQPEPDPDPQPGSSGSAPLAPPPAPAAAPSPPVVRPAPPPSPLPVVAIAPPFLVQLPNGGYLPPVIQPPAPPAARPSPPSGTSPVSSPVSQTAVAPEEKREEEVAVEHSHNFAAYRPREHDRFPGYLAGLALVAALAGVGIRRGGRGDDGSTLALSVTRGDAGSTPGPRVRRR